MHDGESLELLARGAAVGALLGFAAICARGRATPARLTAILFCIAAAAHTLTQMPGMERTLGWAWAPVWTFSAMGAGLFWAFALELFEDRTRLEPIRLAPAAGLLAVGLAGELTHGPVESGLLLVHNLAGAGLIAHALFVVVTSWREDLVEARRRLRGPILVVAGVYALAIIAVQTGELFLGSAEALSPLGAAALMILGFLGLVAFGRLEPDLFGPAMAREAGAPVDAAALSGADAAMAAALDRLMREDRLYREEGLTIAALALRLKQPEHRLRRLINQGLGHRNFSAFLNQWRLADAKAALADPNQAGVPISTIALDAGFGSLGPFNRAFKAETGFTPSEFRARSVASPSGAPPEQPSPAT